MDLEENKEKIESEIAEFTEAITSLDQQIQQKEVELDNPTDFSSEGSPEEILKASQKQRQHRASISSEVSGLLADKQALLSGKKVKQSELGQLIEQIRLKNRSKVFHQLTEKAAKISQLSEELAEELTSLETLAHQGRQYCQQVFYLAPQGMGVELISKLPQIIVQQEKKRLILDTRKNVKVEAASNV